MKKGECMSEVVMALEKELKELENIEKAAKEDIKNAPQGTLRIAKKYNTEQYYWRTDAKDTEGKYIRKSEEKLIKGLVQKDYARKVLAILEPIIKHKKKEIQQVNPYEQVRLILEKFSTSRQKLITPYVYTDDEFVRVWEAEKKQKKEGSIEDFSEIYTEKGECVRSKSEKILADKLYMLGIPYVYELPLYLHGYGYIRPDFTVLNKRTRREYYWEHLGMMDDQNYCRKAIKKIESFERNGMFPGKNLILTYETRDHPLNVKIVERLVEEYLI